MLRLGTYELRSARESTPGARRRFAGAADCLAFLRSHRLDGARARALVRRASGAPSIVKSDEEALRALAQLLFRGAYVVVERAPVRVPMLEPPARMDDDYVPPEVEEEESENLPVAIIPPEYPRVAMVIESGLWTEVHRACSELEEWVHHGMPRMDDDRVPTAHRDVGELTTEEIGSATRNAAKKLERLEYIGLAEDGDNDQIPGTFRNVATEKGTTVTSLVGSVADRLDSLRYGDLTEMAGTESRLHNEEGVPHVFRRTSDEKGAIVRDTTSTSANTLDQLLYQGFEPA